MIWRGDGTNRVCKSLLVLFDQVDAHYTGRDKSNDGTLGDTSHAARKSDHNPDEHGIVRALDITHDPAHGFDSYKFADFLREHWDDRVQYIISNRRIANIDVGAKAWWPYSGENPHDHHVHISARGDDRADDDRQWDIGAFLGTGSTSPRVPVVPPDQKTIDAIMALASSSDLARHTWPGRGRAPAGYVEGVAVVYGQVLRRLAAGDSVSHAMVRIVNGHHDVFDHYAGLLTAAGMSTSNATNVDRLRALFVILTGLGMRESSGGDDVGRDTSANNVTADTAEAGTWQQSRDSFAASGDPELPKLFAAYVGSPPDAVDAIFKKGTSPHGSAFLNFGDPDSDGFKFQALVKARPSIAALFAAIALRTLYTHWGPINRREAEIVPAADALFRQVQDIVDAHPATQGVPHMTEPQEQTAPPPGPPPATTLPALPGLPSMPPEMQRVINLVLGNRDQSHSFIDTIAKFHNAMWPDKQVVAGPQVAPVVLPAPATTPIHKTTAFQLGAVGGVITGILHQLGVIDPNMAILGAIVSAGTAFLGPSGAIVGTIATNAIRALAAWSVKK